MLGNVRECHVNVRECCVKVCDYPQMSANLSFVTILHLDINENSCKSIVFALTNCKQNWQTLAKISKILQRLSQNPANSHLNPANT
jgi:hypothetical protein